LLFYDLFFLTPHQIKQRVFALDALTAGRSDAALGNRGNGGTINSGQRHALQLALEANILDEAHVVFTTLNSAAAESFRTTVRRAFCVQAHIHAGPFPEGLVLLIIIFC
jgi:hypothetical protein